MVGVKGYINLHFYYFAQLCNNIYVFLPTRQGSIMLGMHAISRKSAQTFDVKPKSRMAGEEEVGGWHGRWVVERTFVFK